MKEKITAKFHVFSKDIIYELIILLVAHHFYQVIANIL